MIIIICVLLAVAALQTTAIINLVVRERRRSASSHQMRSIDAQFREMVDRMPIMIWGARPDSTTHYLNRTCAQFTGVPMSALLENGWLAAVHPDDLQCCMDTCNEAIDTRDSFVMEYRLRRADGQYRWILDTGVPNHDENDAFLGYIGCSFDITERRNAEAMLVESKLALADSHHEITQLAGKLITAHEDERRRLARDLHDDLTQRLARLAIEVGKMQSASSVPAQFQSLREELVRLSEDVHALAYRLHPSVLDDLGLVEALKAECDRVAKSTMMQVNVDACEVPDSLPEDTPLCLFRVAQEALGNATRHARATIVTLCIAHEEGELRMIVRDNGTGFNIHGPRDHTSLGLASMRERVRLVNGKLDIVSTPGVGTTVTATVPT